MIGLCRSEGADSFGAVLAAILKLAKCFRVVAGLSKTHRGWPRWCRELLVRLEMVWLEVVLRLAAQQLTPRWLREWKASGRSSEQAEFSQT